MKSLMTKIVEIGFWKFALIGGIAWIFSFLYCGIEFHYFTSDYFEGFIFMLVFYFILLKSANIDIFTGANEIYSRRPMYISMHFIMGLVMFIGGIISFIDVILNRNFEYTMIVAISPIILYAGAKSTEVLLNSIGEQVQENAQTEKELVKEKTSNIKSSNKEGLIGKIIKKVSNIKLIEVLWADTILWLILYLYSGLNYNFSIVYWINLGIYLFISLMPLVDVEFVIQRKPKKESKKRKKLQKVFIIFIGVSLLFSEIRCIIGIIMERDFKYSIAICGGIILIYSMIRYVDKSCFNE